MTQSQLLTLLLDKPGLFVAYGSVVRIEAFIDGYSYGKELPKDPVYAAFGQWLRKKFEIRQDLSWASILSFIGKSEVGSFDLAKELWLKYLEETTNQPLI